MDSKKILVTFDPKQNNTSILSEYDNLVKISYGNVPMNVTSTIGHHVTTSLPKSCTYSKKK